MAYKCDFCGKKRDVGHNVSHAKNRTQRIRKPNLHTHRLQTGPTSPTAALGTRTSIKLRLCTKCLRTIKAVPVKPTAAVVTA